MIECGKNLTVIRCWKYRCRHILHNRSIMVFIFKFKFRKMAYVVSIKCTQIFVSYSLSFNHDNYDWDVLVEFVQISLNGNCLTIFFAKQIIFSKKVPYIRVLSRVTKFPKMGKISSIFNLPQSIFAILKDIYRK